MDRNSFFAITLVAVLVPLFGHHMHATRATPQQQTIEYHQKEIAPTPVVALADSAKKETATFSQKRKSDHHKSKAPRHHKFHVHHTHHHHTHHHHTHHHHTHHHKKISATHLTGSGNCR